MPGQYRAQLIVCLNLIAIMPCRSAAQQPTSGPPQQRPPNIVLIFPDNLGWGEWARTAALGAIPWPDSVGFSPRNETIDAARRSLASVHSLSPELRRRISDAPASNI
jgi:hypothetical protein